MLMQKCGGQTKSIIVFLKMANKESSGLSNFGFSLK